MAAAPLSNTQHVEYLVSLAELVWFTNGGKNFLRVVGASADDPPPPCCVSSCSSSSHTFTSRLCSPARPSGPLPLPRPRALPSAARPGGVLVSDGAVGC
ncbi:unnamed protein product [Pleuronectes platessa]|uniref:Uncharacterized protein n=1 Tax=Pleuronectes platessa TaxID=8262 RepID=A0A9N7TU64_PLEPL|nr:unnamed protein product [Pleuronectes platessa]